MTTIKLSSLKPNPDNPRFIRDEKFTKLKEKLKKRPEFLKYLPIIYDEDGMIISGNQRFEVLKALGYSEIPEDWTRRADDMTEEKLNELILWSNEHEGEYDFEVLANNFEADVLEEAGIFIPDFNAMDDPDEGSESSGEVEDDNYELQDIDTITTEIVLGDLIEIGKHRLICGDSREADVVAKLLEGETPALMITDPPYGVNYDASWRVKAGVNKAHQKRAEGKVKNDDIADWRETWSLMPATIVYIWHGGLHSRTVAESIEICDFQIRSQIIWAKPSLVMGRGHYHWQHEPCWYAVKKGSNGKWAGDRKQSTLWQIKNMHATQGDVDDGKTVHSTQKPVECMARPMRNHEGDIIDPFGGSGTTMVAAEKMERKCFMIELEPRYCQIIIDRMIGINEKIKIKVNGKKYVAPKKKAEK